ncbi:polypyrimidine tract-binding protein (macronuclear) [Tetrahymena thermophila SB210]|uniref:Polypyrimidine tract-binding protein n=1 Tax=Tetrahymena thermophila (strain SB210) TaxID=312017 RepID=I7MA71_TETTS|nr:polypyrimidine tract-binding protein [Tetrahymena thermophila SB210]EAS03833.2 polypyrimidine tract-binding protein [Tetrahymena thermophila SB210]|eukprot:XP_001024078.2 polypyrimidine tract-binding protein [Tetrahymena thermophila SB210]
MNPSNDTTKGQPFYIEKEDQEQGKIQNTNQMINQEQNHTNLNNNLDENCESPSDTTHSNSNIVNEKQNLQAYLMFDSGNSSQPQNECSKEIDGLIASEKKEKSLSQEIENKQQTQSQTDLQIIKKQEQQQDSSSQSDYQYLYYVSSNNNGNSNNDSSKNQMNNDNNSGGNNNTNKHFGISNNNISPQNDSSSKIDQLSKGIRPSKVLLVMVQNPQDEVIEHRIIFEKFSFFGEVEQILIFSKKQPWKLFVDMNSIEVAIKAKNALENSSICVNNLELKMKVQFSSQQNLVLKNGNGGINYKDLNKKFEKTQLSYSIKIDPTSSQSQNLYQSAQIMDMNRRHIASQFVSAQSMQLPNPQLQMLKVTDPSAVQSMTFQVGVPPQKVQIMSSSLIQQDQNQYIPQQMAPIVVTNSGMQTIQPQVPIYQTGRDSPQMMQNSGLAHPKINMTGSVQMQSGNLIQMAPYNQYEQLQQPLMTYSFGGNPVILKDDSFSNQQVQQNQNQLFQSQHYIGQHLNNQYQQPKSEMTSSLQYPINQISSYHQTINMTQSMNIHSNSMTFSKPQESIFALNKNDNNPKNESVEQLDDILERIQNNQFENSGEISKEDLKDLEEQKSNSFDDFKGFNDQKTSIGQENLQNNQQLLNSSDNRNGINQSPFSPEQKSIQPQSTMQRSHSNSSDGNQMTGIQKLDQLIGQAQGSDQSDGEQYPLSDDEGPTFPFQKTQQKSQQQQPIRAIQQLDTQLKTQYGSNNQGAYFINMQGSAGQQNQSANIIGNQLMSSSQGKPIHGSLMMQPYIQNNQLNQNQSLMNQGQVQMLQQQANSGVQFGQFQNQNANNSYQQIPNQYGYNMRQNRQRMQQNSNPAYAQSCMLVNQQQQQNLQLQQSGQVNLQQFDGQNISYSMQIKPNFHSMSTNISGMRMEENMGTFNGSTYIKQGFLEDSKPSLVIYVNHLMNKDITVTHLYNIFSNFGDIVKIILKRNKCTAFIEYTMQENATKAKEFMDKKIFFDNEIRVFYSHFETLQKQDDKFQEQFIGSEQTNRFQKDSKMTLNPPSLVLHISSLKQEICDHEKIHELFRPYGKIEAIHIEKVPPRYMSHIKFSSLKESLMAIAHMHNKEIKGRKMLISFTRKKLDTTTKNVVTYSKNIQFNN